MREKLKMMKLGLISDSHSNPWGQEAVIKYLREEGIEKEFTHNLGDVSGMFPDVIPAIELTRQECAGGNIMGNHDAVLLEHFEDMPKRWERIEALRYNRKTIKSEDRQDLLDWLSSLPVEQTCEDLYFVHNMPFEIKGTNKSKDSHNRDYMLGRFTQTMREPSESKYDPSLSKIVDISQFPQQVIMRGHAHLPSIYKIKRGLEKPFENGLELKKMRAGEDNLTMIIDPDFIYVITVGSACGANTMFTRDNELDYRPAGGIIEYDRENQRGIINLFRKTNDYKVSKFIESVRANPLWKEFPEAQRQVKIMEEQWKR